MAFQKLISGLRLKFKNNNQEGKKIMLDKIDQEWIEKNLSEKNNAVYAIFKKIIDLFFGIIGAAFFVFLFPFLLFFIKIDSNGPVIFKQERIGKSGKKFFLYKLRTMHQNKKNSVGLWREKDKQSITKVGKVLRRLHLDELPQFWNLLRGDVSFIGPRAEWAVLAEIFEKEIPFYKYRYLIKPGIIGWAQINFPPSRSVSEAKEKFEYDLYYIKNRSLLIDLEIILKSAKLFAW